MTDRTPTGAFAPGNKLSPGRKPRPVEQEYIHAVIAGVPLQKWKRIVGKAVEDALEGDWRARTWLSDYIIGKPPNILELRAGDAQLLAQVLALVEQRGLSAQDIFSAMINLLSEEIEVDDDDESE